MLVNDTSKTTLVASYALSASTNSVSEGSSAVFTLTTTNVAGGTSIPYTISGVNSADITGGALSGTAIVSSSGNATITIPIDSDLTTEGTESLTVTAQGISASVLIYDQVAISTNGIAIARFARGLYNEAMSNETYLAVVSLDPITLANTLYARDFAKSTDLAVAKTLLANLGLAGQAGLDAWVAAHLTAAGAANKGAKIVSLLNDFSGLSADATWGTYATAFNTKVDASLALMPYVPLPTYILSASTASVNEGSTAVFNLATTNVAVGTEVSYTLSGISPSDLMSGTVSGKVTIGAGGAALISVPIAADGATEGQESLTISAQGATASIVINDTSKGSAAPTYTLTPAALSVNEGELARVYVNTTNVAAGTALQFGVSGVSSADVIGGLTRLVNVDSLGQAFININTVADQLTEGPETMYITLGTSTTSFIINDTSVTLVGVIDNGGGDGGGAGAGGGGGGD